MERYSRKLVLLQFLTAVSIMLTGGTDWTVSGAQDVNTSDNTTALAVLDELDEVTPHWTTEKCLAILIILVSICAAPCFVAYVVVMNFFVVEKKFTLWPDSDTSDAALRGEVLFILSLPIFTFAASYGATTLHNTIQAAIWGPSNFFSSTIPVWVQVAILGPIVARMMLADAKKHAALQTYSTIEGQSEHAAGNGVLGLILKEFKECKMPPPFLASKMEGIDSCMDGMAIAAVTLAQQDLQWRARFEIAFAGVPLLAPFAISWGLPPFMAGALAMATVFQLMPVVFSSVGVDQMGPTAASLAGLGATAEIKGYYNDNVSMQKFIAEQGRVVYESGFQILLQGSAVMAAGIPISSQPLLLASMMMSALTGVKKLLDLHKIRDAKMRKMVMIMAIPVAILLIFAIVRVGIAQTCPSLSWGISTGCVDMPDALMPMAIKNA